MCNAFRRLVLALALTLVCTDRPSDAFASSHSIVTISSPSRTTTASPLFIRCRTFTCWSLEADAASSTTGVVMNSGANNKFEKDSRSRSGGAVSTRGAFLRDLVSSAAFVCTVTAVAGAGTAGRALAVELANEGSVTQCCSNVAIPFQATFASTASAAMPSVVEDAFGPNLPLSPQKSWGPTVIPDSPVVIAKEKKTESASESAVSGLVAGAAVSTTKQLLLHPVDTVKTRLQVKRVGADGRPQNLFRGLYDGVLPPLLVGAPSGAVFFAAKDSISAAISNAVGDGYADLTTVAAVGLAQVPYWGIRSPAEFLKTRSQAGMPGEAGGGVAAAKAVIANEGVQGLYTGYTSNIAYAFPADAIKFLIYGALKRSAKEAKGGAQLGTIEAAVLGSAASMAAQAVTTPLDVVRTRVMTTSGDDKPFVGGIPGTLKTIATEEGFGALWAGTSPRVARSVLSGAIQFASYEFVKGLFGVEPRKL